MEGEPILCLHSFFIVALELECEALLVVLGETADVVILCRLFVVPMGEGTPLSFDGYGIIDPIPDVLGLVCADVVNEIKVGDRESPEVEGENVEIDD